MTLSAGLLLLSLVTPAQSAEYSVDGWKLGGAVTGPGLQYYSCRPSNAFAQLTTCTRSHVLAFLPGGAIEHLGQALRIARQLDEMLGGPLSWMIGKYAGFAR